MDASDARRTSVQEHRNRRRSLQLEINMDEAEASKRFAAAKKIQRWCKNIRLQKIYGTIVDAVKSEHVRLLRKLNEEEESSPEIVRELWEKYLHDLDFFKKHPRERCFDMIKVATFVPLTKDELLFKRGEPARFAYILCSGEIGIYVGKRAEQPLAINKETLVREMGEEGKEADCEEEEVREENEGSKDTPTNSDQTLVRCVQPTS